MISISRFRVPDAAAGAFHARADAVVAFWRERPGCEEAQVVRNLDDYYTAFGVSQADALYLPPEQRVRIWS